MREMSKLLGFGINQYRLYEEGELPTGSNLLLLRLLVDPVALPHIIATQADGLPPKTRKALDKWLHSKNLAGTIPYPPPGPTPSAARK